MAWLMWLGLGIALGTKIGWALRSHWALRSAINRLDGILREHLDDKGPEGQGRPPTQAP